jgi:hypothetical protein
MRGCPGAVLALVVIGVIGGVTGLAAATDKIRTVSGISSR